MVCCKAHFSSARGLNVIRNLAFSDCAFEFVLWFLRVHKFLRFELPIAFFLIYKTLAGNAAELLLVSCFLRETVSIC